VFQGPVVSPRKRTDPAGVANETELICVFNDMSFDIVKTQESMAVDFRIKLELGTTSQLCNIK